MGGAEGEESVDYGVRLIGLPAGYQMTSLIAAIQIVSFQAQTLEPLTRIKLRQLEQQFDKELVIELLTTSDDEGGPLVAKHAFGFAVASPRIRALLIMADAFPEAAVRYSARDVPHTIINGRFHISGVVDEAGLLAEIQRSLANTK
jgi:alkyl hydroperoxide reductase subunit AhpF